MKRPAFQFYPADWRSNANLRRCTHAERGIWIDVLCLLHDAEEYGVLRWPLAEIAQAVGCRVGELRALVAKGVLKGVDAGASCPAFVYVPRSGGRDGTPVVLVAEQPGPLWYSSRMVRDEHVRLRRGASTQFGAGPEAPPGRAPKPIPKPPPKGWIGGGKGDGPSSSSSSSSSSSDPSLRSGSSERAAEDGHPPTTWAAWACWWRSERGIEVDPGSVLDRKRFVPLAERWIAAGVTREQMRRALAAAERDASEPIAYLPAYVDRVLANSQSPPRNAAARADAYFDALDTFGTSQTNPKDEDYDHEPGPARLGR